MQSKFPADRLKLRRLDQLGVRDANRMQRPLKLLLPEGQEALQLGKFGKQIVVLPNVGLQQPLMIGTPVQDVGGCQAKAFDLPAEVFRNHRVPPSSRTQSFHFRQPSLQAEKVNKLFKIKALAARTATC